LNILPQESLRVAYNTGSLKKNNLARVAMNTTVQPKNITHPADAKLLSVAIQ